MGYFIAIAAVYAFISGIVFEKTLEGNDGNEGSLGWAILFAIIWPIMFLAAW
jgi:hypothetical protein